MAERHHERGNMTDDGDDALETVRALLAASGLHPPEDEVERLARLYPGLRRTVERFYGVDVGDEVPAAVFRADHVEMDR